MITRIMGSLVWLNDAHATEIKSDNPAVLRAGLIGVADRFIQNGPLRVTATVEARDIRQIKDAEELTQAVADQAARLLMENDEYIRDKSPTRNVRVLRQMIVDAIESYKAAEEFLLWLYGVDSPPLTPNGMIMYREAMIDLGLTQYDRTSKRWRLRGMLPNEARSALDTVVEMRRSESPLDHFRLEQAQGNSLDSLAATIGIIRTPAVTASSGMPGGAHAETDVALRARMKQILGVAR